MHSTAIKPKAHFPGQFAAPLSRNALHTEIQRQAAWSRIQITNPIVCGNRPIGSIMAIAEGGYGNGTEVGG